MPAVNTRYILSHPVLQPYVRYFALRQFDTEGIEFPKSVVAENEMMMAFFLHSKVLRFETFDDQPPSYTVNQKCGPECTFVGLQTSSKGFVIYKGPTTILNIHFKPPGFFHIFNISPKELIDKMGNNYEFLSNEIDLLHEEMHEAKNNFDCINLLEQYLIRKLLSQKPKYKHTGIIKASEVLIGEKGVYPIKKLAYDCNMTIQTFEVQFMEQVGINPKQFSRILRFGAAVNTKVYHPTQSWTSIAQSCGYFDQMHLIKDFKEFSAPIASNVYEKDATSRGKFRINSAAHRPLQETMHDLSNFNRLIQASLP